MQRTVLDMSTGQATVIDMTPEEIAALAVTFEDRKAAKQAAIQAKVDALIQIGCPIEHNGPTLHVGMSDSSRADMTGMAATAIAADSGQLPWPDSYAQGWITEENVRIPLATPADGLALAAVVGEYYACIRQNGRRLKDAALAAQDDAALDAVDIEEGWP